MIRHALSWLEAVAHEPDDEEWLGLLEGEEDWPTLVADEKDWPGVEEEIDEDLDGIDGEDGEDNVGEFGSELDDKDDEADEADADDLDPKLDDEADVADEDGEGLEDLTKLAHRFHEVWKKAKRGAVLKRMDRRLGEILLAHKEFGPFWERVPHLKLESFRMPGVNPISHIMSHVLYDSNESEDIPEPAEALRNLIRAGAGSHEATHILMEIQDEIVAEAVAGDADIDESRLRGRMRFVAKVAAAMADGTAGRLRSSRNDPCPCDSGRKYKRCCGEDGQGSLPEKNWRKCGLVRVDEHRRE